jgi:hypothetical protein
LTSEGQKVAPRDLQVKYLKGQLKALIMYKFLEEQGLEEIEQEEVKTLAAPEANHSIHDRIGFDELTEMVKRLVEGGAEIVKEFQRLRSENSDDHYFKSLSWPSSERYDVKGKNRPEGGFITLGCRPAKPLAVISTSRQRHIF